MICSYSYSQAWCVIQCRRHQWRFCSIRKQKDGTSFSAIRIDCNEYRCRKGLFYCGIEINILKFIYILQIQLTTHAINSLEGLICLLFYRVTLPTGLQQIKIWLRPWRQLFSDIGSRGPYRKEAFNCQWTKNWSRFFSQKKSKEGILKPWDHRAINLFIHLT